MCKIRYIITYLRSVTIEMSASPQLTINWVISIVFKLWSLTETIMKAAALSPLQSPGRMVAILTDILMVVTIRVELNKREVFSKLFRQNVQQFSRYRAVTAKIARKFAFRLSRATINNLNIIAVLKGVTILKVDVCKYHPNPPARSNGDGLCRIVVVRIGVWVIRRRQDATLRQPRISLHHICNMLTYESWQKGKVTTLLVNSTYSTPASSPSRLLPHCCKTEHEQC